MDNKPALTTANTETKLLGGNVRRSIVQNNIKYFLSGHQELVIKRLDENKQVFTDGTDAGELVTVLLDLIGVDALIGIIEKEVGIDLPLVRAQTEEPNLDGSPPEDPPDGANLTVDNSGDTQAGTTADSEVPDAQDTP